MVALILPGSAAGFAGVRESGLCPLFLLPFPRGACVGREKGWGSFLPQYQIKGLSKQWKMRRID
jgi:hypothetical protein